MHVSADNLNDLGKSMFTTAFTLYDKSCCKAKTYVQTFKMDPLGTTNTIFDIQLQTINIVSNQEQSI